MVAELSLLPALGAGLAIGALVTWLSMRSRLRDQATQHDTALEAIAERLKSELHETNNRLAQDNREQFLALAGQRFSAAEERANAKLSELVLPVQQKLTEFDNLVKQVEKDRIGAYQGITEQIKSLVERGDKIESATNKLSSETSVLVSALRNPTTRGKWGEVQLRRVVELAGMQSYCDFSEQQSFDTGDALSRPDLTVELPGNSRIFVDAKAPLLAYLEGVETTDEALRREKLRAHAGAMKSHVDALAKKNYQRADGSADFVVMFVPGEAFLSAACTENPDLIEYGAGKNVYIASPLTLMALLRSYALGWQQRRQEENAKKIAELGRELYDRVRIFSGHFNSLGGLLERAVEAYNRTAASLERRVLPQGRKLKEIASLPDDDLEEPPIIDAAPRPISALDVLASKNGRTKTQPQLELPVEP